MTETLSEAELAMVSAVLANEIADLERQPVRASVLRDLILEARDGWKLPPAGLRLDRAVIQGCLDLEGATIAKPIIIRRSRLEGAAALGAVNVRDAKLKRLGLHASTIEGSIMADRVEVESGLFIGGGTMKGLLQIRGGHITGALAIEAMSIGDGTSAVLAAGCTVTGPLIIRRSKISGEVGFARARLGSGLYGEEVEITCSAVALNGEGARLDGDLILERARIAGTIRLSNARIEGRFAGEQLTLSADTDAIVAGGLSATQGLNLADARIKGSVWLDGAVIGKQLEATGLQIDGGSTALSADVIEIGGSWDLSRARLVGQLRLTGARIDGQLRLTEGKVFGSDLAIRADGARLAGGCFMARTVIVGMVRFAAVEMGNQFRLSGSTLKVEHGAALLASGSRFRRDVEIDRGFQTVGAVVFDQATIDGALDVRGAHIKSARISRGGGPPAATPGSSASSYLDQSRVDELALSVVDATIGRLLMPERSDERPLGIVDLSRAHAGSFVDAASAWPPEPAKRALSSDGRDIDHLVLDGFSFDHLSNPGGYAAGLPAAAREPVAASRVRWLNGQNTNDLDRHFKPQAWIALRDRLAAQGYDSEARALDIARRRRQRRAAGRSLATLWQSRLLDWLALYGHNPWRTVGWSAAVVVSFSMLWGWAQSQCGEPYCFDESVMVVANRDAYSPDTFRNVYPEFSALAYSFDVFVPFVGFGYDDHWRPNVRYGHLVDIPLPHAAMLTGRPEALWTNTVSVTVGGLLYCAMVLEVILGLILTSLLVTGFSGLLLRQE